MFYYIMSGLYGIMAMVWGVAHVFFDGDCLIEMNTTLCITLLCGISAKLGVK